MSHEIDQLEFQKHKFLVLWQTFFKFIYFFAEYRCNFHIYTQ